MYPRASCMCTAAATATKVPAIPVRVVTSALPSVESLSVSTPPCNPRLLGCSPLNQRLAVNGEHRARDAGFRVNAGNAAHADRSKADVFACPVTATITSTTSATPRATERPTRSTEVAGGGGVPTSSFTAPRRTSEEMTKGGASNGIRAGPTRRPATMCDGVCVQQLVVTAANRSPHTRERKVMSLHSVSPPASFLNTSCFSKRKQVEARSAA